MLLGAREQEEELLRRVKEQVAAGPVTTRRSLGKLEESPFGVATQPMRVKHVPPAGAAAAEEAAEGGGQQQEEWHVLSTGLTPLEGRQEEEAAVAHESAMAAVAAAKARAEAGHDGIDAPDGGIRLRLENLQHLRDGDAAGGLAGAIAPTAAEAKGAKGEAPEMTHMIGLGRSHASRNMFAFFPSAADGTLPTESWMAATPRGTDAEVYGVGLPAGAPLEWAPPRVPLWRGPEHRASSQPGMELSEEAIAAGAVPTPLLRPGLPTQGARDAALDAGLGYSGAGAGGGNGGAHTVPALPPRTMRDEVDPFITAAGPVGRTVYDHAPSGIHIDLGASSTDVTAAEMAEVQPGFGEPTTALTVVQRGKGGDEPKVVAADLETRQEKAQRELEELARFHERQSPLSGCPAVQGKLKLLRVALRTNQLGLFGSLAEDMLDQLGSVARPVLRSCFSGVAEQHKWCGGGLGRLPGGAYHGNGASMHADDDAPSADEEDANADAAASKPSEIAGGCGLELTGLVLESLHASQRFFGSDGFDPTTTISPTDAAAEAAEEAARELRADGTLAPCSAEVLVARARRKKRREQEAAALRVTIAAAGLSVAPMPRGCDGGAAGLLWLLSRLPPVRGAILTSAEDDSVMGPLGYEPPKLAAPPEPKRGRKKKKKKKRASVVLEVVPGRQFRANGVRTLLDLLERYARVRLKPDDLGERRAARKAAQEAEAEAAEKKKAADTMADLRAKAAAAVAGDTDDGSADGAANDDDDDDDSSVAVQAEDFDREDAAIASARAARFSLSAAHEANELADVAVARVAKLVAKQAARAAKAAAAAAAQAAERAADGAATAAGCSKAIVLAILRCLCNCALGSRELDEPVSRKEEQVRGRYSRADAARVLLGEGLITVLVRLLGPLPEARIAAEFAADDAEEAKKDMLDPVRIAEAKKKRPPWEEPPPWEREGGADGVDGEAEALGAGAGKKGAKGRGKPTTHPRHKPKRQLPDPELARAKCLATLEAAGQCDDWLSGDADICEAALSLLAMLAEADGDDTVKELARQDAARARRRLGLAKSKRAREEAKAAEAEALARAAPREGDDDRDCGGRRAVIRRGGISVALRTARRMSRWETRRSALELVFSTVVLDEGKAESLRVHEQVELGKRGMRKLVRRNSREMREEAKLQSQRGNPVVNEILTCEKESLASWRDEDASRAHDTPNTVLFYTC